MDTKTRVAGKAAFLALSAMSMAAFASHGGFGMNFHRPVRERDSRSEEDNQRRLEAAEAKRARRAAKAKQ